MRSTVIGLPRSGKTTLLQALSSLDMSRHSGPVTVRIPDERLTRLSAVFHPEKTTPAEIVLNEAAFERQEGGRRSDWERYLDAIKGSELFVHVLAAFADPLRAEQPDPRRDLLALDIEMILADMATAERIQARLAKEQREPRMVETLGRVREWLEAEKPLRTLDLEPELRKTMSGYNFVTLTPQLLAINLPEDAADWSPDEGLLAAAGERHVAALPLGIAAELALIPAAEQAAFLAELGLSEPAVDRLVREILGQLSLVSFFTVGEDEVRAWLVPADTPAKQAAGRIHSDLERGFIRGEVVSVEEFFSHGSLSACRSAGVLRQEGKDYLVKDGDIMHVKFNV